MATKLTITLDERQAYILMFACGYLVTRFHLLEQEDRDMLAEVVPGHAVMPSDVDDALNALAGSVRSVYDEDHLICIRADAVEMQIEDAERLFWVAIAALGEVAAGTAEWMAWSDLAHTCILCHRIYGMERTGVGRDIPPGLLMGLGN